MVSRVLKAAAKCCPTCLGPIVHERDDADAPKLVRAFKALGDETRLAIIGLLGRAGRELCVCEIEGRFALSQPTISHHLKVLRDAGLVTASRRGTWVYYALDRALFDRIASFHAELFR